MNAYELTLPEFAFVEGSDHDGDNNILKGRTVIQHIRSYTVLELFDKNDAVAINGFRLGEVPPYTNVEI